MRKFFFRVAIGFLLAVTIIFPVNNLSSQMPVQAALNSYKIMPLGASITAGIPLGGGYRIKLWNTALANNWNIDFVGSQSNGPESLGDKDHEGHPGYRIDQIAELVDDKLSTYKPQIILLYIGTNDAIQNYDIINAPHRIQLLSEQIFHALPKVQLLLASLGPASNDQTNDNIKQINAALTSIVSFEQAQGHNIKLVDMSKVLTKNDLVDGIHPQPEGYDKMADEWAKAIQPLLPVNSTTRQQAVVAYTGGNLTGIFQSFSIGIYKAFLGDLNIVGNDMINSLRVPQGLKVRICQNEIPDFGNGGLCQDYGPGDYADLGALDSQISYLDVELN